MCEHAFWYLIFYASYWKYLSKAQLLVLLILRLIDFIFWLEVLTNILTYQLQNILICNLLGYSENKWLFKANQVIFKYNPRFWSSTLQNRGCFVFYRGLQWHFLQILEVGLQTLLSAKVYQLQRSARYLSAIVLL